MDLCDNILEYVFSFLNPSEYILINKNMNKIAYKKIKKSVTIIEKWYIRQKTRINETSDITPVKFIALFKPSLSVPNINRKKLPEQVACVLNLNLYSLSNLSNKGNKKKRKISEVIEWFNEQNLSQYQYLCLLDHFSITHDLDGML